MKIAIIINTSWNIYNFRLELLKKLQKEGHQIICMAPYDRYADKLKEMGFEYHNIKIENKGTNPIADLKLIFNYHKLLKKLKPDIVLGYTIKPNIYGSIATRLLGIPTISNISGLGTVFLNDKPSSKVARWLYKVSLVKNHVFFQNNLDRELFIKNKLVKRSQTGLVPGSGINTEKYKAKKPLSNDKEIKFLMIARLVKDKGIIEYIDAIKLVKKAYPHLSFKLLGDLYHENPTAITQQQLDSWIKEGLIEYLGHSDDVKSEIEKIDVVVLPSYREGLSRVLLEASCLERPIITTDVAGCKDVVEDGVNGLLCHAKSSEDLARQIIKMAHLPHQEKLLMGKMGRKKAIKEFDEKIVINKYLTTINQIVNHPS